MILESLLDTDIYKYSMMQAVLHQFPGAEVEYQFKCRSEGVDLRPIRQDLEREIEHLCSLKLGPEELNYLSSLRYMKSDFIEFLRLFHLQSRFVEIGEDDEQLTIRIRGPWLHTILFEVPVLAIISELYSRHTWPDHELDEGRKRLNHKVEQVKALDRPDEFVFADFGTRRRFSREWHDEVVETFASEVPGSFRGTSNVRLAKELGLVPIGTMAHEFIQACQALGPRLAETQRFAFEVWAREYRGDLGIALSDTYSLKAFLRDFDMYFCKLFDGARQDSGDPMEWGEAMIEHYRNNRVDPKTRNLIFSDSLTIPRAAEIWERFRDRINVSFGIGTNLTHDTGVKPVNIVIKMTECNGQPVVKLSDSPGKIVSTDQHYLAWVRQAFDVPAD
ncbi:MULTISPECIES: nicotinate phosphoribosyltransferase [unclassified Wenzhouxiangella]|uniref:nicotinate phosphoribosyltransferase n=1 Tax=unclassified Wenzhouxiangella TaxID=2613841 RepID=UPI000E32C549|nr:MULTISPECIES: nicotinate phosphoribosyltransferase [unclassified Wenzhouxiangella]RFF28108.1 nicotinate phosphoribosyltransferase [Wenzhouxiangella sp. 15181]RFP68095.1 nicotinate phosphoribosyltransferase [Wenzhouxiangella sp. 15190]